MKSENQFRNLILEIAAKLYEEEGEADTQKRRALTPADAKSFRDRKEKSKAVKVSDKFSGIKYINANIDSVLKDKALKIVNKIAKERGDEPKTASIEGMKDKVLFKITFENTPSLVGMVSPDPSDLPGPGGRSLQDFTPPEEGDPDDVNLAKNKLKIDLKDSQPAGEQWRKDLMRILFMASREASDKAKSTNKKSSDKVESVELKKKRSAEVGDMIELSIKTKKLPAFVSTITPDGKVSFEGSDWASPKLKAAIEKYLEFLKKSGKTRVPRKDKAYSGGQRILPADAGKFGKGKDGKDVNFGNRKYGAEDPRFSRGSDRPFDLTNRPSSVAVKSTSRGKPATMGSLEEILRAKPIIKVFSTTQPNVNDKGTIRNLGGSTKLEDDSSISTEVKRMIMSFMEDLGMEVFSARPVNQKMLQAIKDRVKKAKGKNMNESSAFEDLMFDLLLEANIKAAIDKFKALEPTLGPSLAGITSDEDYAYIIATITELMPKIAANKTARNQGLRLAMQTLDSSKPEDINNPGVVGDKVPLDKLEKDKEMQASSLGEAYERIKRK